MMAPKYPLFVDINEFKGNTACVLIAFVVLAHAGMVWAQANEEIIVSVKEPSAECSTVIRPEYRFTEEVGARGPATNGVVVAEDMRCRQCRGKCAADNLRCRSQCLGDDACLAQCDDRKSTCEATCKQLFSCE